MTKVQTAMEILKPMNKQQIIEHLLLSFKKYYNIYKTQDELQQVELKDYYALAEFHSINQQYFLVKSLHISDADEHEYVYFALFDELNQEQLNSISEKTWNAGLQKINVYNGHKKSDIKLIIIADRFSENLKKTAKKIKYRKNFKHGLYGWSDFHLLAFDVENQSFACNRYGKDLTKLLKFTIQK